MCSWGNDIPRGTRREGAKAGGKEGCGGAGGATAHADGAKGVAKDGYAGRETVDDIAHFVAGRPNGRDGVVFARKMALEGEVGGKGIAHHDVFERDGGAKCKRDGNSVADGNMAGIGGKERAVEREDGAAIHARQVGAVRRCGATQEDAAIGVAFGAGEELQGKGVNIEGALAALPPTRLAWPAEPAAGVWLGSGEHIGKGGGKGPMGQTVGVDEGAEVFGRGVGEGDVVRREHPATMEQERPARLGRRGVRHRG